MVSLGMKRHPVSASSFRSSRVSGDPGRHGRSPETGPPLSRGWRKHKFLKLHAVGALQAQNLTRLLRGGDLIAEFLDQAPHLGDLLGVALGELAAADIEAVLEPDADIAAHHHGL